MPDDVACLYSCLAKHGTEQASAFQATTRLNDQAHLGKPSCGPGQVQQRTTDQRRLRLPGPQAPDLKLSPHPVQAFANAPRGTQGLPLPQWQRLAVLNRTAS